MSLRDVDHTSVRAYLADLEDQARAKPRRRNLVETSGTTPFDRQMVHPGYGGYGYGDWNSIGSILPGADYDYASQAGDLWRNSAVAACLRVIEDNFPQPELQVRKKGKREGGRRVSGDVIEDHPLPRLVNRPNPFYDRYVLWAALALSAECDGNAYALKIRSRARIPVQLWWVPHWMIIPRWRPDGTAFIDWYQYTVNGKVFAVDPADVIHFRYGSVDPRNERLAISKLKAGGLRTICGLNETDGYTATLLRNSGVPNITIEPLPGFKPPTRDQAEDVKEDWREMTTGERRGDPFIPMGPFKIVPIGFSPEQLALDKIPARLEDQVCSLTGVNAMIAGLTSGAQHKTYANMKEARAAFYDMKLVPMQGRMAECLEHNLLGDPGMGNPETEEVCFSYDGIDCMQEQQDLVWNRAGNAYSKGMITRAQAKEMCGVPHDDTDLVYAATTAGLIPASLTPEDIAAQTFVEDEAEPEDDTGDEEEDAGTESEMKSRADRVLKMVEMRLKTDGKWEADAQ